MNSWPILSAPMLGVGAAGGIAALVALRVRQRWLLVAGLALLIAGHGLFCAAYWGLINAAWIDRMTAQAQPSWAQGDPWGTLEAQIKSGSLSDAEFASLVTGTHPLSLYGGNTRDYLSRWLRAGTLSPHYADLLTDTLIKDWPNWNPGSRVVDDIAPAVLASAAVSPASREAFIKFMAAARSDPKTQCPSNWTGAVTAMMIDGTLARRAQAVAGRARHARGQSNRRDSPPRADLRD